MSGYMRNQQVGNANGSDHAPRQRFSPRSQHTRAPATLLGLGLGKIARCPGRFLAGRTRHARGGGSRRTGACSGALPSSLSLKPSGAHSSTWRGADSHPVSPAPNTLTAGMCVYPDTQHWVAWSLKLHANACWPTREIGGKHYVQLAVPCTRARLPTYPEPPHVTL